MVGRKRERKGETENVYVVGEWLLGAFGFHWSFLF